MRLRGAATEGRRLFIVRGGAFFVDEAAEFAVDEGVDVAIHDSLDVAGFHAGAVVLDHLVGLEDVGADLAAPCDVPLLAILALDIGALFVLLDLVEFGLEHFHGQLAVATLAALGLAGDDDAGGLVDQADGGLHLVHVLPALAAAAEGIELDIGRVDLDGDIVGPVGAFDGWGTSQKKRR